ncbi:glycosyltransferase family 2 protein [Tortispora caseinolytica NRRL Y-17796]|uniref:chitin synthase n=1 Tax=Tortispora caseinolytica NRRL Y-17796 TaxID=767744 RepID=A0A1E4T9V4_9ASCO|nr:glycosyltransferase family 2 protein [Tortispora caseinolytica NRRL Y-17796]
MSGLSRGFSLKSHRHNRDYQDLQEEQPVLPRDNSGSSITRRKTLVRPERSRRDDEHNPHYHYEQMAQQHHMNVLPSTTGYDPILMDNYQQAQNAYNPSPLRFSAVHQDDADLAGNDINRRQNYPDLHYSDNNSESYSQTQGEPQNLARLAVLDYLSPANDIRLKNKSSSPYSSNTTPNDPGKRSRSTKAKEHPSMPSPWLLYCNIITFFIPGSLLKLFGMPNKAQQSAWREKIGLISVIIVIAALVGFLTFGFTESVCRANEVRIRNGDINTGYLIIHGRAYDLTRSSHPGAPGIPSGANVLYPPVNAGGMDASFLFQNVNGACKGLITPKADSTIPSNSDGDVAWYFPCKLRDQSGTTPVNHTFEYYPGYACHLSETGRNAYYDLKVTGEVYFTWEDIADPNRDLIVYSGTVIDLTVLDWLDAGNLSYPEVFNTLRDSSDFKGTDISLLLTSGHDRQVAKCLMEIARAGSIDSDTVGCIASQIVLYVSLVFIVSVVLIKFLFAVFFAWVWSYRLMGKRSKDFAALKSRDDEIEEWTNDIYQPAPHLPTPYAMERRGSASGQKRKIFPNSSRFSTYDGSGNRNSVYGGSSEKGSRTQLTTMANQFQSSTTRLLGNNSPNASRPNSIFGSSMDYRPPSAPCGFIHEGVIPQPPVEYQPFGFPLVHSLILVTAYSESEEGIRTTLDSVATTDYPNSHKLLFVVCDGLIKGSGNSKSTPDICLSMMQDLIIPENLVVPYSYVAVASGSKRHNMAKVYAGFYKYDDATVPLDKQQRIPMILIVKCGTPEESTMSKPGNRGKRDSQVILMSFLQKVTFDDRMTQLEYEIFNGIWRITGLSPDYYEVVLMVDADTKVFPDCMNHMVAAMVYDPEIMGLCGETKIANKMASYITMIQVFEYYISHHQTKAFESVFGGVTCLPGCFSMYRIKAPKGYEGYWVPILANPDIVDKYSGNNVDTLHKKNLLLLGEDRYLSTLMLRTFPKRKQVFLPQAVCKTVVPDKLKILMSQRRRWINSTVHNLMELILVRDLCGVFCISMQFVVFIELVGTLVLPAVLAFTIYVVVIAIHSNDVPIVSIVLLTLILGLPGVLIIVTAKRWSYVLWMLVYLSALPVWNILLPLNAYWKFDDFSWGETRTIQGEEGKGHDAADGEFDHSKIIMRTWREFEMDRIEAAKNNIVIPSRADYDYDDWDSFADSVHRRDSAQFSTR